MSRGGRVEVDDVRSRFVEVTGRGRMHVREATGPRRAPTLVLLHGLGATAALNWDACIPTLAQHFRVIAPDHRGHGRGIRCQGRFRLEDCADDAAALIRQECRGPVLVAGYSMGGPITQLLCQRHPELVAGMVLCATSRDFRGRTTERIRFAALALIAAGSRFSPSVPEPVRTVIAAAASLGTFTSRDWVADLPAPAAVVATTQDRLVPLRRQLKLAAALDAPVVELDAGHLVPHQDPLALAAAMVAAVELLPRRARRRRFPRAA